MAIHEKQEAKIKAFLNHMNTMIEYWEGIEKEKGESQIRGFAFSMLVEFDGGGQSRGYDIICKETGQNVSIGYLHEIMNKYE